MKGVGGRPCDCGTRGVGCGASVNAAWMVDGWARLACDEEGDACRAGVDCDQDGRQVNATARGLCGGDEGGGGWTAVHEDMWGVAAAVLVMLGAGVTVDAGKPDNRRTAPHWACWPGGCECGADVAEWWCWIDGWSWKLKGVNKMHSVDVCVAGGLCGG